MSVEPEKEVVPEEEVDEEELLLEELERSKTVAFPYSPPERGHKEVFIIKGGNVVEPVERVRRGRGGFDVYSKESLADFDVALEVNVSRSGKHKCFIFVNNPNDKSIAKLLEIHDCERVRKKLSRYLKK